MFAPILRYNKGHSALCVHILIHMMYAMSYSQYRHIKIQAYHLCPQCECGHENIDTAIFIACIYNMQKHNIYSHL